MAVFSTISELKNGIKWKLLEIFRCSFLHCILENHEIISIAIIEALTFILIQNFCINKSDTFLR